MTARSRRLQPTRRVLPVRRLSRAPLAQPAQELCDEIRAAMQSLELGTVALSEFEALIRRCTERTAELTMRCQIPVLDAEHVNRLAAAAQRLGLHQAPTVRKIQNNAVATT